VYPPTQVVVTTVLRWIIDPEIDRVDRSSRSISGQIESIVGSLKSRSSRVDRRERSIRSIWRFNLSLSIKLLHKRIYFNLGRVNLYWTLTFTPTSTYWDCSQTTTNTYHDVSLRHTARVFKALYFFSVNFSVYRLWNLGLSMIPHNIGVNLGGWGS
jgi:hypothetical protein